ncbi:polyhydroxyalkanoate depolymerase [Fulvimarina sp. 2208YS6-2-32]|uniref:Polyhydroxyalkanoate depolymerase n=1 Tax=Fulvimarina uroteuthidis TaxID=3098149 RepID=A0ABU5HZY6_9HYPH|nr:polyhydroxyalkanoate depolymerase [Fulvimarina sp. 2208YS6-2-32]MDY8108432.1 polyhydroxyalkanoate depolymerase [Fulvimarina sp. 2208YS6-2-32]
MLYYLYEWNHAMLAPMRAAADVTRIAYQNPLNPISRTTVGRSIAAAAELFERTTRVYAKPSFDITETVVGHTRVDVKETVVLDLPFCQLLHFERQLPKDRKSDPRFLVVAPLSGHHATLLRGTVEALLPYADVYITDWKDARTVPIEDGKFDLSDYTQYVIDFLRHLGPDTHVLGVCQPAVPVLMAVAHMEMHGDDCYPATMTLMGGPLDTRINPTAVNRLAQEKGIDWFRDNVIMQVPFPQPGFRRLVYPGFLQLTGFMSMNLDRHMAAHKDFYWHLVKDDGDSAEKHRTFYDEYNAVMDMTAEFYLETVEEVFIKHSLPKGTIRFNDETIDLTAIKRVALLTVEGENDDISGVGQTEAAHDMCPNIPEDMRVHYVQPKVGHYGVFNGSRFKAEIVPRIIDFALTHGTTHGTADLPKKTEVTKREGRNFGAHAERRAKAGELGQRLGAGGETGIADPLMFENNMFAVGERFMRAFAEPAGDAFAQVLRSKERGTKSVESAKVEIPAKTGASAAPAKPADTSKAEPAPAKPARAKVEAEAKTAKASHPAAKTGTARSETQKADTKTAETDKTSAGKTSAGKTSAGKSNAQPAKTASEAADKPSAGEPSPADAKPSKAEGAKAEPVKAETAKSAVKTEASSKPDAKADSTKADAKAESAKADASKPAATAETSKDGKPTGTKPVDAKAEPAPKPTPKPTEAKREDQGKAADAPAQIATDEARPGTESGGSTATPDEAKPVAKAAAPKPDETAGNAGTAPSKADAPKNATASNPDAAARPETETKTNPAPAAAAAAAAKEPARRETVSPSPARRPSPPAPKPGGNRRARRSAARKK